jgi:hypothetical protein
MPCPCQRCPRIQCNGVIYAVFPRWWCRDVKKSRLPVPLLVSLGQDVPNMAPSVIHYSVAQQVTSALWWTLHQDSCTNAQWNPPSVLPFLTFSQQMHAPFLELLWTVHNKMMGGEIQRHYPTVVLKLMSSAACLAQLGWTLVAWCDLYPFFAALLPLKAGSCELALSP